MDARHTMETKKKQKKRDTPFGDASAGRETKTSQRDLVLPSEQASESLAYSREQSPKQNNTGGAGCTRNNFNVFCCSHVNSSPRTMQSVVTRQPPITLSSQGEKTPVQMGGGEHVLLLYATITLLVSHRRPPADAGESTQAPSSSKLRATLGSCSEGIQAVSCTLSGAASPLLLRRGSTKVNRQYFSGGRGHAMRDSSAQVWIK